MSITEPITDTFDCPHCGSKKIGFTLSGYYQPFSGYHQFVANLGAGNNFLSFWVCNKCQEGLVARMLTEAYSIFPFSSINDYQSCNKRFTVFYPKPPEIGAPAYTPKDIANFYCQGADSLNSQNYDACGMLMRKVADITTKHFGFESGNLKNRIDAMKDAGFITKDLAEWAHEIRNIGNEAAHDAEPFTQKEADDIKKFTELFLMYVFMLPGMLAERKKAKTFT